MKKRRLDIAGLAVIFIVTALTSTRAQQSDPYADDAKRLKKQEAEEIMNRLRIEAETLGYAESCQVTHMGWSLALIEANHAIELFNYNTSFPGPWVYGNYLIDELNPPFAKGKRRLLAEGCKYFHDHPEVVQRIRSIQP